MDQPKEGTEATRWQRTVSGKFKPFIDVLQLSEFSDAKQRSSSLHEQRLKTEQAKKLNELTVDKHKNLSNYEYRQNLIEEHNYADEVADFAGNLQNYTQPERERVESFNAIDQRSQSHQQNHLGPQTNLYTATAGSNYLGHAYRNMRLDEDLNMTNMQQFLFVFLNFSMACLLLIAVNCSIECSCGVEVKQWLLIFSIVLALGSLVSVLGFDIARQPRSIRRAYSIAKFLQYLASVTWLIYGNFLVFFDDDTCPREVPWLSATLMLTVFFGWLQLALFIFFLGGILVWLLAKCCGRETTFTPYSLWQDQQQFFDRDPQRDVNDQNKKILETLEEHIFEQYRREVRADMIYGFQ